MNPKSAKALTGAAVICLILGMLIISPAGSLFLYAMAALCAAIPTVFGDRGARVAGAVVLVVSLLLAVVTYPRYGADMTRYRERAKTKSPAGPAPLPSRQERE